jgi:hypothetical protein
MRLIPTSVTIGGTEISTGSLFLVLVFLAFVILLAWHVIQTADSTAWKRLYTVGSALAGFLAGWFGKSLKN